MSARVQRHRSPCGNRDADRFQAVCVECDWSGAAHSNRTIEGQDLAARDRADHNAVHHTEPGGHDA